jgi:hypothetical protein
MNRVATAGAILTLIGFAQVAWTADYWNDAVQYDKNGKRQIEMPPVNPNPAHIIRPRPKTWEPPTPAVTFVMESPAGLVECLQGYYRSDGTCERYTPGQYKSQRMRAWSVKRNGTWWQCSRPETRNMCTSSWTDCSGDPRSAQRCIPLHPQFKNWLTPASLQP